MARSRRPPSSGPEFTADGATKLDETQTEFRQLLEAMAIQSARRRGAGGVYNTDVESCYRSLLSSRNRPILVDVLCEVGLFVAGAIIGYAVTLLTATPPSTVPGFVLLLAGLFLGIFTAILKHILL